MEELVIKFDVPVELTKKFELALNKVVTQFIRRVRFSILDETMSKSKLTDEQVRGLADELKERVAKRHGL